jgi:hypothetical protein
VHAFPDPPPLSDPDVREAVLGSGHLWLREHVAGAPLRFTLADSGLLTFADADRRFDGEAPPGYGAAVRHVREAFDRDAFRDAVDDPGSYTFGGVATRLETVAYDWDRLPPFLGVAVAGPDRTLPLDRAESAFDRLGLRPLNALRKELPVRDFHPDRYAFPDSAWYDGPVAGVRVENRRGAAGFLAGPAAAATPDPVPGDPDELAARFVTPARVDAAVAALDARGHPPTVDAVRDRVVEAVCREEYARLVGGGRFDAAAFRRAATEPVRAALDGR